MRVLQGLRDNLDAAEIMAWAQAVDKFIILRDESQADPEIPLLGYFNLGRKFFTNWLDSNYPCIVMNRPHIGGWTTQHKLDARRFSVNGYAPTRLGDRAHERYHLLGLDRHVWKVQKVRRVLIAPPAKLTWFWHQETAEEWAERIQEFFRGQKVKVRRRMKTEAGTKKGQRYTSLWQDLDWADLVVSYGSSICCEAFWYGKKVISLGPCATWTCCDHNLDNWQDPTEPSGRAEWHEHVAWTQFTREEILSGQAPEMIVQYQGWPTQQK